MSRKSSITLWEKFTALKSMAAHRINRVSRRNWIGNVTLILCLALGLSMSAAHVSRGYTSDDVAIQNILQSWTHGETRQGVTGTDNFSIKIPFYLLADAFLPNSRLQLFILAYLFNLGLILCLVYFIARQASKLNLNNSQLTLWFLPILAYFSLAVVGFDTTDYLWDPATQFASLLMNPNSRNTEIGLVLLAILWSGSLLSKPMHTRSRMVTRGLLVFTFLLGILFYSDPFFVITFGGALLIVSLILWLSNHIHLSRLGQMFGLVVFALVWAKLLNHICISLGYTALDNISKQIAPIAKLGENTQNTVQAIFRNFEANFWGAYLSSHKTAILLLNSGLVIFFVIATVYAARISRKKLSPQRLLLLTVVCITIAAYLFTSIGQQAGDYRYLFPAVICGLPLMGEYLVHMNTRSTYLRFGKALMFIYLLIFLVNSAVNFRTLLTSRPGTAQAETATLAAKLKEAKLSKGYATYWDANILTYLSDRSLVVLPLTCSPTDGKVSYYNWQVNTPEYYLPSTATYYIANNHTNTQCGIENKLGQASRVIPVSNRYTIYIYDHDIGLGLPTYTPSSRQHD